MRRHHANHPSVLRLAGSLASRVLPFLVTLLIPSLTRAATPLPEFTYRHITIRVESADGHPIPNARLYAFSPDYNLLFPRRDQEPAGRDDVLWQDAYLATTAADGTLTADLPPGNWRFLAAGSATDDVPLVAWTSTQIRDDTQTIRLAPTLVKHWTFRTPDSTPLSPTRLFLKPDTFPIWIPIDLPPFSGGPQGRAATTTLQLSPGPFHLVTQSPPTPDHPGYILSFPPLSDQTPDGPLTPPDKPASLETTGGNAHAVLSWSRPNAFGLHGDLPLPNRSTILLSPGPYTLSYRRPLLTASPPTSSPTPDSRDATRRASSEPSYKTPLTATFIGQLYNLQPAQTVRLNFDAPLTAAVDHELSRPDKSGNRKLVGQLYLVDPNGHLLGSLLDANQTPVPLTASVTLAGKRYPATEARTSPADTAPDPHEELDQSDDATNPRPPASPPFSPLWGQTLFRANVGPATSDADATWTFTAPPGLLLQPTLAKTPHVTVTSNSFKIEVPEPLRPHAANVLAQADALAHTMEQLTGRTRRRSPTTITISPASRGAVSTHDGTATKIGTRFFYSDQPMTAHGFVHELAHNFGYTHGGLQEAVVEVTRCSPGDQVSAQPVKWLFLDRMNALATRAEVPYPNVGLYLYAVAQAGPRSLLFLSRNEPAIRTKLANQYSPDELTNALLSTVTTHDFTPLSLNYGLPLPPNRAPNAIRDTRALSDTRR